ncbi:MAG: MutS-related protein [Bacteroidales bacterium]
MEELINYYREFHNKYSGEYRKIKQKLNILAFGRVITFVLTVYLGYLFIKTDLLIGLGVIAFLLGLFIYLVIQHGRKKDDTQIINNLIRVNSGEIEALRGNISNFHSGREFKDTMHEFTDDLEIFGESSLFQYITRTCTYAGKNKLANWLRSPLKSKENIKQRQSAIKELSKQLQWRQKFTATGNKLNLNHYNDTQLFVWTQEQPWLISNLPYQILRWVMPLLTFGMIGLTIYGMVPLGYFILLLLVNLLIIWNISPKINGQYQKITNQLPALKNYAQLLQHIEKQNFSSTGLIDLQKSLFVDKHPSSRIIKKLFRICDALDNRNNILADIILKLFFLWDVHQTIRLENWHRHYAKHIENWIETIGNFDALISLANFHYNHSSYAFPEISESKILEAEDMGHPLIPQDRRVNNNFAITKKGDTIIITGANMAGKSTFLRTIGVNLVLGMVGAPVCAGQLTFQITCLFTSMNITDSLSKNESYFYAEIKRLKKLIDQASKEENILVLLDEILTGTNTQDKEKASKAFLERLISMQVTSVIATHDLSLTTLKEKYPDRIHNKRFEVELAEEEMKYDYLLRDGIAQNMNALELLKQMKLI